MSAKDYSLRFQDQVFSDSNVPVQFVHDLDGPLTPNEIDALVASGDCFVTLATNIDEVTDLLGADATITHPQLNKLASTLLYLQRHYQIKRKPSEYRQ